MKIPVTLTDEQRWTLVHLNDAVWRVMKNRVTDIQDLNEVKKLCKEFLDYPIIQALTGE